MGADRSAADSPVCGHGKVLLADRKRARVSVRNFVCELIYKPGNPFPGLSRGSRSPLDHFKPLLEADGKFAFHLPPELRRPFPLGRNAP